MGVCTLCWQITVAGRAKNAETSQSTTAYQVPVLEVGHCLPVCQRTQDQKGDTGPERAFKSIMLFLALKCNLPVSCSLQTPWAPSKGPRAASRRGESHVFLILPPHPRGSTSPSAELDRHSSSFIADSGGNQPMPCWSLGTCWGTIRFCPLLQVEE